MDELVFIKNNIPKTDSLKIAARFGKRHDNVLQDIEKLSCSKEFNVLNFQEIEYTDSRERRQRMYEMSKDGFTFLVMGYTGKLAGAFKEQYINEFNRMEQQLKQGFDLTDPSSWVILLEQSLKTAKELEKQKAINHKLNSKIEQDKPKIEFIDQISKSVNNITIQEFSKIIEIGEMKLFKLLREQRILMRNNVPYQKYIEDGIFKVIEKLYDKKNGKHTYFQTMITGKGQSWLHLKIKELGGLFQTV